MERLLVEIGTEEIPAGYIRPALDFFRRTLERRLSDARIAFGEIHTYGTPMRLAVMVSDVADRQEALSAEVLGPPESVGFDADGSPTVAARKFAEKAGVDIADVRTCETPKGRYLCAEKTETARDTVSLLQQTLPALIQELPFPKTMRWADLPITFARPIRWLMALYGDAVVEFTLGNLTSDRVSFGHRFMSPEPAEIPQPGAYVEILSRAHVIADIDERRRQIESEIETTAKGLDGSVLPDPDLVDIVTNLVEYPVVVAGRFDDRFLELPDEVLITAMREHQKYFAVTDASGALIPHFIVANNTRARDMAVVAKGHERVLRARLEDALFFYKNDLSIEQATRVEKLSGVLFQAQLGSMYEKTERVKVLAGHLAALAGGDQALRQNVERAAWLCKSDLVSQVVVEFPKLQGVMGRIYAAKAGEPGDVPAAIEEHHRPVYSGGALPTTRTGTLLAIADKLDTLCGCFSVGLIPTGASDPYALRRQSIGIVQMLRENGLNLSIQDLIRECLRSFESKAAFDLESVAEKVYGFMLDRISHLLVETGYAKDTVAAVTSVSVDKVPQVWQKVEALDSLRREAGFEPLAVAFKRVANIIRKARQDDPGMTWPDVDPDRFDAACESDLLNAYQGVKATVDKELERGQYNRALAAIATLRAPVDAFFDGVMVMAEDVRLRENRLAMLARIAALFETIADFSKIST